MTNTKRPRTSPASVCTSKPWNVCSAARTRSFWMRVAAAAAQSLICRSASSLVHRKRVANRRPGGGNETEFSRRHPRSSWRSRADRRFLVFVHRLSDAAGAGGPPWPAGPCGQRPGLNVKAPFIDSVVYFDKRILDLEAPSQEVIASDQKRLVVDAFARYRIQDALRFYQTLGSIAGANSQLSILLNSALPRVLGEVTFTHVVRDQRAELMARIR